MVPNAAELLIFSVPEFKVTPPVNKFNPDNVNVPLPDLTIPFDPEITPPSVSVLAVVVIVGEDVNVIAPVP